MMSPNAKRTSSNNSASNATAASTTSGSAKHTPLIKIPKGFGELVSITGPNSISIHRLSPMDLGLTVGSVGEVIRGGVFQAETVALHLGLSIQDRALWRTRIVATALDILKPIAPGQSIVRPRASDAKTSGKKSSSSSSSSSSSTSGPASGGKKSSSAAAASSSKFSSKFASNASSTSGSSRRGGSVGVGSRGGPGSRLGSRGGTGHLNRMRFASTPADQRPSKGSKTYKDNLDFVDLVRIDTAKMYATSSEMGRKWMIGIFAAPSMANEITGTTHLFGEGALQSRRVNFNSPIFSGESKDSAVRELILSKEASQLKSCLEQMEIARAAAVNKVLPSIQHKHKSVLETLSKPPGGQDSCDGLLLKGKTVADEVNTFGGDFRNKQSIMTVDSSGPVIEKADDNAREKEEGEAVGGGDVEEGGEEGEEGEGGNGWEDAEEKRRAILLKKRVRLTATELEEKYATGGRKKPGPKKQRVKEGGNINSNSRSNSSSNNKNESLEHSAVAITPE